MHKLMEYICEELEDLERKAAKDGKLSMSELQYVDMLAHAKKNLMKAEEMSGGGEYSMARSYEGGGSNRGGRSYEGGSYEGGSSRGYSSDSYYYDGGSSYRRGRGANGRFVSRDGSEMARKLREMMESAPDENTKHEIQRLADKMEQM